MGWLQNQRGSAKLRPDQKISVMRVWENVPKRVQGVRNLMRDLAKL
jgi:transcription-repair coupling factor (superfamily II helicase)